MARPRQITDPEILEEVRQCIFEHGVTVSTVTIAERLGISQATLFKRFQNKQQLVTSALAPEPRPPFLHAVESGPVEGIAIQEQLVQLSLLVLEHFRGLMPRLMALHAAGVTAPKLWASYDVPPPLLALAGVQDWFERAQTQGLISVVNPQSTAMIFLGSLHARVFFDMCSAKLTSGEMGELDAGDSDQAHAENLVRNLWQGLAPQGVE